MSKTFGASGAPFPPVEAKRYAKRITAVSKLAPHEDELQRRIGEEYKTSDEYERIVTLLMSRPNTEPAAAIRSVLGVIGGILKPEELDSLPSRGHLS